MRQTTRTRCSASEKIVKDIKRAARKQYSSEEKIRIVLDGLRGEDSIAELCPTHQSLSFMGHWLAKANFYHRFGRSPLFRQTRSAIDIGKSLQ